MLVQEGAHTSSTETPARRKSLYENFGSDVVVVDLALSLPESVSESLRAETIKLPTTTATIINVFFLERGGRRARRSRPGHMHNKKPTTIDGHL
jgi:hypothetical protein